jgi:voltage-gated potassium channel Kch
MGVTQRYIMAVYWTVATLTSVGYGDVHAHTDTEKLFAIFVMLLGTLLYGYYIASAAASAANADFQRSRCVVPPLLVAECPP